MIESKFRLSVEPRRLSLRDIERITDAYERMFAIAAHRAGFSVHDGGMITLVNPVKMHNGRTKTSTVPDFRVDDVYVEITCSENLTGRKTHQKKVMREAGLGLQYVQLTGSQVQTLCNSRDFQTDFYAIVLAQRGLD